MGKLILTTLLAIFLLVPQAGLQAAGNQSLNGKPFSDLNTRINDLNTRVDDLDDKFVTQEELDSVNEAIHGTNTRIDDLEKRVLALEEPDPPGSSDVTFSGEFLQGQASSGAIRQDWSMFKSAATPPFVSVEIKSSIGAGVSAKCSDPAVADNIAGALQNFDPASGAMISLECDGLKWNVGVCLGGAELNAGMSDTVCTCEEDAIVVRPLIGDDTGTLNSNWGGVGKLFDASGDGICSASTHASTQTLEVILAR